MYRAAVHAMAEIEANPHDRAEVFTACVPGLPIITLQSTGRSGLDMVHK